MELAFMTCHLSALERWKMYTSKNFKTKKELKDAVAAYNTISPQDGQRMGRAVTYYQPNDMGFAPLTMDGTVYLEGPHYPQPHKWYAQAEVESGVIVKVK